MYNCCKVPANNIYYEEVKAVDMLLKIRKKTKERDFVADTLILLTLGYLLDESNNKEIISGQGNTFFNFNLILDFHFINFY